MPHEAEPACDVFARLLLTIAMSQDDPAERKAMLDIMGEYGLLPEKAA